MTAALAGAADARTVTFDRVKDYLTAVDRPGAGSPYREGGVTVTALNGVLAWDSTPGTVHVDDAGTDFTSGLMFTMNRTFAAAAFSIVSLGYSFLDAPKVLPKNIRVTGFVGGATVADKGFRMTDSAFDNQRFRLGSGFDGLDTLIIQLIYPRRGLCDAPCAQFDLDWVKLEPTPVPLPASAGLLGAAGLLLWGLKRRRRT